MDAIDFVANSPICIFLMNAIVIAFFLWFIVRRNR